MANAETVFDEVMLSIGNYSKYQKRFSFYYNFIFVIISSMPYMSLILVMAIPDHWCHIPGRENTNFSIEEWRDIHLPKEENSWGQVTHSYCKMYNLTSIQHNGNGSTNDEVTCQHGYDYDHTWYIDTIPSTNDWVCEKELYIITNVFTASTIGEVTGAFVLGQLGDYMGRRPIYLIANVLSILGKILGILTASSFYIFLFACFMTSFPSISAMQSTLAISMEMTDADKRAQLAQVQNYGWCLSMVILSLICWASPTWILFTLVITFPLAFYIVTYRSMIESPRWLAGRGRIDDCVRELRKIAKMNGTTLSPEVVDKLRNSCSEPETVYGIMSTVSSWRLAKNTIVLSFTFIVYTLCYGIFMLNTTNLEGNPFLQFLYQSLVELPGYILGRYLCDKIGRRYTGAISYIGSTIMFIPVLLIIGNKSGMNVMNCFILAAKFCMSVAYYTQVLQSMEIYPTCLRQTGMSLGTVISGIFGILSPYIIYLGTAYDARYPYIIIGSLSAIAAVLQLLLPETLHVKLPETLHEAKVFGMDQRFFSAPWNQHKAEVKVSQEESKFI